MLKERKRGQGGELNSLSCLVNLDVFFGQILTTTMHGESDKTLFLLTQLLQNGSLQDTHS